MNILLILAILFIIGILIWAIFGDRDEKKGGADASLKDSTFRRRAQDRLIEEQFPDRNEAPAESEPGPATAADDRKDGVFKLPYLADEIIPEISRFRIYRRTLINSEVYAQKGNYDTAISLYEGVRARINDTEVRTKIEADIDYLKYFKKRKEDEKKRREEQTKREMRRSDSAGADKGSEVKVTIDGSVPETLTIGPMPNTINIGIMDPHRAFDADTIAEKVTEKLKDIAGARPTVVQPVVMEGDGFRRELDDIRRKMEDLDRDTGITSRNMARIRQEIEKSIEKAESEELRDMKSELHDLRNELDKFKYEPAAAQSRPVITQAKFDQPVEVKFDPKPLMEILKNIPRQYAPEPRELRRRADETPFTGGGDPSGGGAVDGGTSGRVSTGGTAGGGTAGRVSPGGTGTGPGGKDSEDYAAGPALSSEKMIEKERRAEEDENDFELLSEYGKDKFKDELTDEEIFEKILKEKDEITDKSFEVIGEKKEDYDEVSLSDTEIDFKKREDESFYKKLLSTDRRKRKELPILKVSYDFTKLPDDISLSREKNILEYSFYKYKSMLTKANDFIKKRKVRNAINYYKVVMSQNIPPEFKTMIRRNISDLTDYLEKYLTGD